MRLAITTVDAIATALEQFKVLIEEEKKKEEKKEEKKKEEKKKENEAKENENENENEEEEEENWWVAAAGMRKTKKEREDKRRKRKERKMKEERFKDLLASTLMLEVDGTTHYPSHSKEEQVKLASRDLGCHTGLMLAGVQRYIFKSTGDLKGKRILCDLFIDISSSLATGIPVVGFLFGTMGSLAKHTAHKLRSNKKENKLDLLRQAVKHNFDEHIAGPIFFDKKLSINQEEGEPVEWEVQSEEFSKWYEQVISWNELAIKRS